MGQIILKYRLTILAGTYHFSPEQVEVFYLTWVLFSPLDFHEAQPFEIKDI